MVDANASPEPLPHAQPGLAPPSSSTDTVGMAVNLTGGIPGLLESVLQYLLDGRVGELGPGNNDGQHVASAPFPFPK